MRKAIKFLSVMLVSVLAVSLLCACDSGNADGESSESPQSISAASDNTTSAESNASNTNNSGNASSNDNSSSGEASTDSDYEEMMSYVNQLSPELSYEQVLEIMGEPDYRLGSGINYDCYEFGKYRLEIVSFNDGGVYIYNNETSESSCVYPSSYHLNSIGESSTSAA